MNAFDRLLLGGALLLGVLLLGPVLTIPLHIPLNYNEGWNAAFDARATGLSPGPLYPGPRSLVFDNYPPLGFFVVGLAGRAAGDMIAAGRAVALAALLASAALLALCARRLGADRRSALAAALLLLLTTATFYRGYVAMDDPQWLAHATMLAGLALLLRGGWAIRPGFVPPTRQVVLAALLMTAGGFVKHNLVALPAAVTLWLSWRDRRLALSWIAAATAAVLAGTALTALLFGRAAFTDILHHPRLLHAGRIVPAVAGLAPLLPMAIALGALLRRRRAGDAAMLVAPFGAVATAAAIAQRLGDGVNYNAGFEALIAVCLGSAMMLASLVRAPARCTGRPVGPAVLLVFAALPVACAAPWSVPAAWRDVTGRTARELAWRPVIERLAVARGPVLCAMPSLCIWAGKPFVVDMANLTEAILAGRSPLPFRQAVAAHRFALIEDDPAFRRKTVRSAGADPLGAALRGFYAPVATGPGGILLLAPVPASEPSRSPAPATATGPKPFNPP